MFNKKSDEESTKIEPSPGKVPSADPNVRKRSVSVIGPTLRFKGELEANEDLLIEGQIEGSIAHQDKNLTVGKQGRVKADIHARIVEVFGEVEGDIQGDEIVRLAKGAKVKGNIRCGRISMEDGALFAGSISMDISRLAQKQANLTIADGKGKESALGS